MLFFESFLLVPYSQRKPEDRQRNRLLATSFSLFESKKIIYVFRNESDACFIDAADLCEWNNRAESESNSFSFLLLNSINSIIKQKWFEKFNYSSGLPFDWLLLLLRSRLVTARCSPLGCSIARTRLAIFTKDFRLPKNCLIWFGNPLTDTRYLFEDIKVTNQLSVIQTLYGAHNMYYRSYQVQK